MQKPAETSIYAKSEKKMVNPERIPEKFLAMSLMEKILKKKNTW